MGTKYQPHAVRHSQERRISARESLLDPKKNPLCFRDVDNYDQEIKKVKSERAQLSRITPPGVSDAERPILLERKKQLEKALVAGNKNVPEMPSQRQMEDNPDGSTSHYLGWERSWATNTVDPGGNLAPAPMLPGGGGQYGAKYELKDIQYRLKAEQGDLAIGRALEIDSANQSYQLLFLRRQLMKGKLAVVEKQLRRIQENHPLNPEALQLQADLYKSRGNSAQAEKLMRQANFLNDSNSLQYS